MVMLRFLASAARISIAASSPFRTRKLTVLEVPKLERIRFGRLSGIWGLALGGVLFRFLVAVPHPGLCQAFCRLVEGQDTRAISAAIPVSPIVLEGVRDS